jgi:hypothetical protein
MSQPKPQRVKARRANPFASMREPTTLEQDLVVAATIAKLMDSQFQLGPVKFGLDSLIGLVPVAGDAASFVIGMYPIYLARKHRLGALLVSRMFLNLGADFITGAVPVVGDVLDVAFKANLKNLRLLQDAAAKRLR